MNGSIARQLRYNCRMTQAANRTNRSPFRFSLRETLGFVTIAVLGTGLVAATIRLRAAQTELDQLRGEVGYIGATEPDQVAASRAPSDQPLTYRIRVRIPKTTDQFRLVYSTHWPAGSAYPQWYSAIPLVAGESVVTVRVAEDPRDDRWKISTVVTNVRGTRRMATTLPNEHVAVFRGSHEVISTGIARGQTVAVNASQSIRVLDERWLVGEGSLLLYGDRAPDSDQIGIFAELQPDIGPL